MIDRRTLMAAGAAAVLAPSARAQTSNAPRFTTQNVGWQTAYDKALAVLDGNVQTMPRYSHPVLIEGSAYQGIWMECGPHEALVYRKFRPDVAKNSHMCFFELQRADGQLPCNNKVTETGFGQIQMVVPIAATAWELARATGDDELLDAAYTACSMWDAWLLKHRNTRGTGLTEGFCTYDTGHDNSPRWTGIPAQCPNKDAKLYPSGYTLPWLCPDLSATTYGARKALAEMAKALGKTSDADRWSESAERMRALILSKLYVAEDAAFYDLDANNQFVKVRGDVLTRMCSEHVVDQKTFDDLWVRQISKPTAFWAPYPLPSISLDDPKFVRPIPRNSWGGASQALTALRAPRWMESYGRPAEFGHMMDQWCKAVIKDGTFRQQMDPLSGEFNAEDPAGYSPAALVMVDYTWRLVGVDETGEHLNWNIRPDHPAAKAAVFTMTTDNGKMAELRYGKDSATLILAGKPVATIAGTGRITTDKSGKLLSATGIDLKPQKVVVRAGKDLRLTLMPNGTQGLTA